MSFGAPPGPPDDPLSSRTPAWEDGDGGEHTGSAEEPEAPEVDPDLQKLWEQVIHRVETLASGLPDGSFGQFIVVGSESIGVQSLFTYWALGLAEHEWNDNPDFQINDDFVQTLVTEMENLNALTTHEIELLPLWAPLLIPLSRQVARERARKEEKGKAPPESE